jgi:hypothetical protein
MQFTNVDDFLVTRLQMELLPGKTGGRNKVPQVRFLESKVINKTADTCELVVIFEEPVTPQYPIEGYQVFIQGLYGNQRVSMGETHTSPFRYVFPTAICENKSIVISVQTVLNNGFKSDIDQAATTALTL